MIKLPYVETAFELWYCQWSLNIALLQELWSYKDGVIAPDCISS